MKKIAIFGSAGHARDVADICCILGYTEIIFLERAGMDMDDEHDSKIINESQAPSLAEQGYDFAIGIADNVIRKKVYESYPDFNYPVLVHPSATFGRFSRENLEKSTGTVVTAGVRFANHVRQGNFGIYNLNCTVGHDTILENYVNVSTTASVAGYVLVKEGCYIGSGAVVLQGENNSNRMVLGHYSTVGAGAVVTKHVASHKTVIGVPARELNVEPNRTF